MPTTLRIEAARVLRPHIVISNLYQSYGIKNNYIRRHHINMYSVYFDGSCKGDRFGCAGTVIYKGLQRIWQNSRTLVDQPMSCNVAEYEALITGLEYLKQQNKQKEPISILGDSKLVINQMFGSWRIKNGRYKHNALKCHKLLKHFADIHGTWVPRELNKEADKLSNRYKK